MKKISNLFILGPVLAGGLISLFLSADHAFSLVSSSWVQAMLSAALIEAGMIADAVYVYRARSNKEKFLGYLGIAIKLTVSGTYNYLSAERNGSANGITNQWQLVTLALGPLASMLFLSLQFGATLGDQANAIEAEQRLQAEMHLKEKQLQAEMHLKEKQLQAEIQERQERNRERRERRALQRVAEPAQPIASTLQQVAGPAQPISSTLQQVAGPAQPISSTLQQVAEPAQPISNKEKVLQYFSANPESSNAAAGRELGVSHTTIANILKSLQAEGVITKNGKVTVL